MEDLIIIFIQGVYISDKNIDSSDDDDDISTFDTIPTHFTGLEYWLQRTNVRCAHCCLEHDMVPVFIPQYFKSTPDGVEIAIEKVLFCSFPCASAYIETIYKGSELESKKIGLRYVYKLFTNEEIDIIPQAPSRYEIDTFGGSTTTYTVARYRRHLHHLIPFTRYII